MSCGSPHETSCAEVIERVYVYLDNECDDELRQRIRVHLDECSPCLRQFGIESDVKALVARCCGSEHAPDGLRERVLARVEKIRVQLGTVEYRAE
jgi:mycothiol system anti-sigma-R factor